MATLATALPGAVALAGAILLTICVDSAKSAFTLPRLGFLA